MLEQMEGSHAVADAVALCRPEVVCAYPISPQSHIVKALSDTVRTGELTPCEYVSVESEFAAMSVGIGASATGARVYTATASQGLLYMCEALYNASGLGLPIVMTLANRAIGAPINIWNDHSDSMSQRDSGWIQLYAETNQEALDLHIQADKLAEELSLPVMVCMDGFILTHAHERVDIPSQEQVDDFLPRYEPRQLLDPPLHEFLPDRLELVEHITVARLQDAPELAELEHQQERMRALEEGNPMLGTRGVRLGLIHPEVYEMQARAIFRAVRALDARTGHAPRVEIMIPLVAHARELELASDLVIRVAAEEGFEPGRDFGLGTMIELPRACFVAGDIARHAEFFSFGTNDLTQTALGFSRDDIEARVVPHYADSGILERSPFARIDEKGVGELVRMAVERGRAARPGLEVGICGEHGGDPASIGFFHAAGLDYVSCSPFRVPIARVAAAQAASAS